MSDASESIGAFFSHLVDILGERGPAGELARLLSSGHLNSTAVHALIERHGVDREPWFRKQCVDFVIGYMTALLNAGRIQPEDLAEVRSLRVCLGIEGSEFVSLRPAELAQVLGEQVERILEDHSISASEELLQVELQAALGIGYDDYLALTRLSFERSYHTLQLTARVQGVEGALARKQLEALEPVYRLATARQRSLGSLF